MSGWCPAHSPLPLLITPPVCLGLPTPFSGLPSAWSVPSPGTEPISLNFRWRPSLSWSTPDGAQGGVLGGGGSAVAPWGCFPTSPWSAPTGLLCGQPRARRCPRESPSTSRTTFQAGTHHTHTSRSLLERATLPRTQLRSWRGPSRLLGAAPRNPSWHPRIHGLLVSSTPDLCTLRGWAGAGQGLGPQSLGGGPSHLTASLRPES